MHHFGTSHRKIRNQTGLIIHFSAKRESMREIPLQAKWVTPLEFRYSLWINRLEKTTNFTMCFFKYRMLRTVRMQISAFLKPQAIPTQNKPKYNLSRLCCLRFQELKLPKSISIIFKWPKEEYGSHRFRTFQREIRNHD